MVRGLSTIPSAEHMVRNPKPAHRPGNPSFSCGPCAKRPGWSPASLDSALVGRSHRSPEGRARLRAAIDKTRAVLRLPADYRVAIVPGSDTGAFEMCLWSMLGARGVDVLAWESFGKVWLGDVMSELKLPDVRRLEADFGLLPDMSAVDFSRDVVFTANGTTSGVRIPDYDWIAADRTGLTLVDATSAIFAQAVAWSKVDALTFSWQKVLGGEAAHGMVILSPRAVERLETYRPAWPLPKIFRMTRGGKLNEPLFEGETINTPSMLCVEDYINALDWAESLGGVDGLIKRAEGNAQVLFDWIERTPWVANLAANQATWSTSSVCLVIADPAVSRLLGMGRPPSRAAWSSCSTTRALVSTSAPTGMPPQACGSGQERPSRPGISRHSRPGSTGLLQQRRQNFSGF
jgi:phosphoserine aminotransferase